MFRTVPLSSISSFLLYTQQRYMSYRFQLQLASRIRAFRPDPVASCQQSPDPASKLSGNQYDIYRCCVYSEKLLMMERGTVRNM